MKWIRYGAFRRAGAGAAFLALLVAMMTVPSAAHATCINPYTGEPYAAGIGCSDGGGASVAAQPVSSQYQGWAYLRNTSGVAYRWSGHNWLGVSMYKSQVWAYPYGSGWHWIWTPGTGWLAVRTTSIYPT